MKILHLVPALDNPANGMAVAARLIAQGQNADLADTADVGRPRQIRLADYEEVWVHSTWTPLVWAACLAVLRAQGGKNGRGCPRLVRMTHGNLDPLRCSHHGWKKRLAAPVEHWLFSKCDRIVVTGTWEEEWCRSRGVKGPFETIDLKRYFKFADYSIAKGTMRHFLYLGRRHPLKGVAYLETAVRELNSNTLNSNTQTLELRVISDATGEELEKVWNWCDCLVLPTLSENFGLVVAEALERGKFVITTDGAPAWSDLGAGRGIYLKGFRDGDSETRIRLLKNAILDLEHACPGFSGYAFGVVHKS